jgi:hypothetical protein
MILVEADAAQKGGSIGTTKKIFDIPSNHRPSIHDNVLGEKSKFSVITNKILKDPSMNDELKVDHYSRLLRQYLQNKENEKNQKKRDLNETLDQISTYISNLEKNDDQEWEDEIEDSILAPAIKTPMQRKAQVSFADSNNDNNIASTAQGLINRLKNIEERYSSVSPSTSRQAKNNLRKSDNQIEEAMDISVPNLSIRKTPTKKRGLKRRIDHSIISKAKRPALKTPRGREVIKTWETRSRKKQTKS